MLARIEILNPGLQSTIQDYGRYTGLDYGVSQSGVMDIYAYEIANTIVGNEAGTPVMEILGGSFKALILNPIVICVTGAKTEMKINSVQARLWESYSLRKGDYFELGTCQEGIRNYIAIQGNWCGIEKFLDSYSTDEKAKIGGMFGRRLKRGDVLSLDGASNAFKRKLKSFDDSYFVQMKSKIKEVRILLGPQEDAFASDEINTFFNNDYELTTLSNRMGLRLKGQPIKHMKSPDILSDAIPFGAIQIPGDGQPIIMMAERQTTGGYTKIGTVVSSDLPILAQTQPGEFIRFIRIEQIDLKRIDQERINRQNETLQKNKETEIHSTRQFNVTFKNQHFELLVEEMKSV